MENVSRLPIARTADIALAPSPVQPLPLTMRLMLTAGEFNAASAVRWFGPRHPELNFDALAAERRGSLAPADRRWLKDRLTRMSMADGFEKDDARGAAWLSETGRLLMQEPTIPGDILAFAIDEAIKRSERGFMPKVGQIRAIADPLASERQRETLRLEAMARVLAAPAPDDRPSDRPAADWYTPKRAQAIYDEVGFKPDPDRPARPIHRGPPQMPSEAFYRQEMGDAQFHKSQAARAAREAEETA